MREKQLVFLCTAQQNKRLAKFKDAKNDCFVHIFAVSANLGDKYIGFPVTASQQKPCRVQKRCQS